LKYIFPVILAVNTALTVLAFFLIDVAQDAAAEASSRDLWSLFGYVFIAAAIINGVLFLISLLGIIKIRKENEEE
jgi:hypothetical protein